jgi:uncharacterized membrane protein YhfC
MNSFFSETGTPAWDFIQISTTFLLTMLVFFGVKNRRYLWLRYFLLVMFALDCLFVVAFHDGLTVKFFAALMLTSTLVVAIAQRGKTVMRGNSG